jgi:hypothetical protein
VQASIALLAISLAVLRALACPILLLLILGRLDGVDIRKRQLSTNWDLFPSASLDIVYFALLTYNLCPIPFAGGTGPQLASNILGAKIYLRWQRQRAIWRYYDYDIA